MNSRPPPTTASSSAWRGQWALVTGATSGIGRALAEELGALGANLVLTGRRIDRLASAAAELTARHGIRALYVQADLSAPTAPDEIFAFTQREQVHVDVLVNNAGLLEYGAFVEGDLNAQLDMVRVHCLATVHLTRLYLPGMVAKRSGQVLMVATTTLVPAPYLSIYAATKGFLLLFAEGLREETAQHGINVSALCAGPTESELHLRVDAPSNEKGKLLQPAQEVARRALQGLEARKARIHPSRLAWVLAVMPRFLPRSTVSGGAERMYRPASRSQ